MYAKSRWERHIKMTVLGVEIEGELLFKGLTHCM